MSYNFADVISQADDYPVADSAILHSIGLNLSLDIRDNPHYTGKRSFSEAKYRWNFLKRWGTIGYAGVATVFDAINESDNWKPLPAVGTGIRFKAFTETNFNVGLDVAAGIDDWGIYFQIGEVF